MNSAYFAAMAADVFAQAGGDPANSRPLAAWAEDARTNRDWRPLGVVVALDGRLIAETVRLRLLAGLTAVYVAEVLVDLPDAAEVDGTILDLACGVLRHQIGQPVIHVPAWQVCSGRARSIVCAGVPRGLGKVR